MVVADLIEGMALVEVVLVAFLSSHPDIPEPFRQTAFTVFGVRTYTMTVGAGGGGGAEGLPGPGYDRKTEENPDQPQVSHILVLPRL